MDYPRRKVDSFRGRRAFRWEQRFCVRRPEAYIPEDQHVLFDKTTKQNIVPIDTRLLVDEFLGSLKSDLDPPCFMFDTLKSFLESEDVRLLSTHQDAQIQRNELAMVDDRRDLTGGASYLDDLEMYKRRRNIPGTILGPDELAELEKKEDLAKGTDFRRNWDSELYSRYPPRGDERLIFTESLNERQLYARLDGEV